MQSLEQMNAQRIAAEAQARTSDGKTSDAAADNAFALMEKILAAPAQTPADLQAKLETLQDAWFADPGEIEHFRERFERDWASLRADVARLTKSDC